MASTINKTFKTSKTADETRQIVNKLMLDMPALKAIVDNVEWQGNKLVFSSKIGDGTITVLDYSIIVFVNLNFVGSLAKGQIEQTLDKEFLKLNE